ncbi:Eco57I restriction-modification methylase domain-containing protein [Pontibacter sp. JH31]|uniref:site-specific DNA-methyltransferase (adenine-specific) n=1 Tax=Pontibacter aquaedesilientis TaxID=2766980 RepID=A0ABR7XFX8_9BACT|nr:TaqI-like C-terminal specificity domain-containing protein [Pontibacter aquaedesilientis]MBD1396508.1 Eco57I restriction-modification methylase domain-containing protein [Pontibacter aquaedesilientis]
MPYTLLRPRQALNKAYLRLKTSRSDMEQFKAALRTLLDSLNPNETEEHAKNHLRDFLKAAFYGNHGINTKGKTDLVIHTGNSTKSNAGVLLEVKRPTNKADMPTPDNLNHKAMHELLLYYLRERVQHHNHDLRHLIVTSVHEWFVFDALEFDRLFYRNTQLRKDFTDWSEGRKASSSTDFFYKEIASPAIASLAEGISYTYFNLKEYEKPLRNRDLKDDVKLLQLYKLFSPPHLLKESFANDANSLDRNFYLELLHIIGLEEVKEGGRKLIQRKAKPSAGSLLEAAYQKLRSEDLVAGLDNPYAFGNTRDEQLFNVALELCITWINRVLFLKLLEAQLISYHQGDRRYAFMSTEHLREFDDLNELFFDVLAERPQHRTANVRHKFAHIPYLNSSLFETTALEKRTLRISNLKDRSMLTVYPQTVLRNQQGQSLGKGQAELPTLEYLLRFLGSYDFGAEGKEAIQEENKTLITASVLGLIFEKINGYRDGSFYTPGFITMYMSREAIRRAVVQRFADRYSEVFGSNPNGITFEALQLFTSRATSLEQIKAYNDLINSLRICDPAVGSGHYLVSALNELIVIKAELRILLNRQGKPLHFGSIEVQNDELIVTDTHGELFSYTVHQQPDGSRTINPQVQELQETLFHEKQTIIENCLFGVDINSNSVKICRLRLWIELLKNAYYCQNLLEGPYPQDLQDSKINRISAESNSKKFSNPDLSSPVCYADVPGMRDGFGGGNGQGRYSELQTLPNIDINIKQGNSLLSRYPLSADLHEAFGRKGHSLPAYRQAVAEYKHTNSKEIKKQLVHFLEEIKQGFRTTLANNDPLRERMARLRGQISVMQDPDLFGAAKVDKAKLAKLKKELQKLETEREQIETNKVYEGAFEWRFEFPEVLDEEGNYLGFDVVIGNPPYISSKGFDKSFIKYLNLNYETAEYQLDLYVAFFETAINLLKDFGNISFITPNSWLKNLMFSKCRNFILKKIQINTLIPNLDNIFEEASVDTLVIVGTRNKDCGNISIGEFKSEKYTSKHTVNQCRFVESDSQIMNVEVSDALDSTFQKIRKSSIPLEKIAEITRGVNSYDKYAGHTQEQIKNKVFHADFKKDDSFVPELKGKHVFPYIYKWDRKTYISYGNWLAAPRDIKFFQGERLLMRQVLGKTLFTTVIEEDFIIDQSVFIAKIKDDYADEFEAKYLQGLLGSKFMFFYFTHSSNEFDALFPKIKIGEFRLLPIAQADEETKAGIRDLVERVLAAKQADAGADTSALEAEIDLQVYRLYDLTFDEVLLVEPGFALSREAYEMPEAAKV